MIIFFQRREERDLDIYHIFSQTELSSVGGCNANFFSSSDCSLLILITTSSAGFPL